MKIITNKILNDEYQSIKRVDLKGWVKSNRDSGTFGFINFTDGTCLTPIQIVYKKNITKGFDELKIARTGAAIQIIGDVILTPNAKQPFEILTQESYLLKQADENFPLQKKHHTVEYLREISHLRPRTNLFFCVMNIRSKIFKILNNYFFENDYTWVTTPVFTSNDAEGAGESFSLAKVNNEEFFEKETTLSVTGQLHAEAYAMAFRKVFTFGPQFRAEKSHTNRHASEFWMLEPEIAFANIDELMVIIEDMMKYLIINYQKECEKEIRFLNEFIDNNLNERLNNIINMPFIKISYNEVIEELLKALKNGVNFENKNIKWGMDLDSEHERYICEKVFNSPTFVYNYPIELKAFYMKNNSDQKTVAGVDLLVPGIGELCGGSQRESDYETILAKSQKLKMNLNDLQWYLDLRKYGYYQSSGFGLGFERLLMFITGVNNIRDVIPFARTHGAIQF